MQDAAPPNVKVNKYKASKKSKSKKSNKKETLLFAQGDHSSVKEATGNDVLSPDNAGNASTLNTMIMSNISSPVSTHQSPGIASSEIQLQSEKKKKEKKSQTSPIRDGVLSATTADLVDRTLQSDNILSTPQHQSSSPSSSLFAKTFQASSSTAAVMQKLDEEFGDEPMTEFQKQQLKILEPLSASSQRQMKQATRRNSCASSSSLGFRQESESLAGSFISEITLDTIHQDYFLSAQTYPPVRQVRLPTGKPAVARRKVKSRQTFLNPSNAFIQKAAILEDYEYDQEGFDLKEEDGNGMAVARAPPVVEKWEMLADDIDYRPRTIIGNSASGRNSDFEWGNFTGSASLLGKSEPDNHELLIMYLQSTGTDLESAESIARKFQMESHIASTMGGQGRKGGKSVLYADAPAIIGFQMSGISSPARIPIDKARSQELKDTDFAREFCRDSSGSLRGNHRRPRSALQWNRYETPGAVQVDSRAFGAAYRAPPDDSGVNHSNDCERDLFEDLPVQAELVEPNAFSYDGAERGLGGDKGIVFAESTPLSFKSLMKERSFRRAFILVAIVFAAVFVISLSVTLSRKTEPVLSLSEAPSTSPTSQPTRIDSDIADVLAAASESDALFVEGTPQRRALAWMSTFDALDVELADAQLLQRYALVVLYFATGGEDLWLEPEKWLDPSLHECDWGVASIECEGDASKPRLLRSLDLSRQEIAGQLPNEIGMFSQLTSLKLSKNGINGTIPSRMFSLEKLEILELAGNNVTGTIPTQLSSSAELSYLDLSNNQLTSSIPEELFDLANLFWLDLSLNELTGTISSALAKLKLLTSINLRHNMIVGGLPDTFDEVPKLDFILLGTSPLKRSWRLSVDLTRLFFLCKDDNMLSGSVPPWSTSLLKRQEVTVSHNQLIGPVPSVESLSDIGGDAFNSIRLSEIDVSYNLLTGTMPILAALTPSIRFLDISGNKLTGSFPSGSVGFWPSMEELGARDCHFEGKIPVGFSGFLSFLDFSGNKLTGTIPTELAKFASLQVLSLSNNQLSSTIPVNITNLPDLAVFKARNCSLTGTVPKGLASYSAQIIDLGLNQLNGTIHTEFGSVVTLEVLSLDGNELVGSIPTELASLEMLTVLTLDNNRLTGTIPSEFSLPANLANFTVARNELNGSVPEGLCSSMPELGVGDVGCDIRCTCCSDPDSTCD
jgi:Leucine-rich repeat (LRR) protein